MSLGPAAWAVIPITWPPQDCLDLVPDLGAECMHSSICKAALNTSYAPKKSSWATADERVLPVKDAAAAHKTHISGTVGIALQARRVLEKIRGTKDVDEEYQDILEKAELAALVKNPWTLLLFRKKYRYIAPCF